MPHHNRSSLHVLMFSAVISVADLAFGSRLDGGSDTKVVCIAYVAIFFYYSKLDESRSDPFAHEPSAAPPKSRSNLCPQNSHWGPVRRRSNQALGRFLAGPGVPGHQQAPPSLDLALWGEGPWLCSWEINQPLPFRAGMNLGGEK